MAGEGASDLVVLHHKNAEKCMVIRETETEGGPNKGVLGKSYHLGGTVPGTVAK